MAAEISTLSNILRTIRIVFVKSIIKAKFVLLMLTNLDQYVITIGYTVWRHSTEPYFIIICIFFQNKHNV